MSSDDDQPAAKRPKTYNADGPVEDDKTARGKLREAGFDPDDVHTARSEPEIENSEELEGWHNITPMTHFAFRGDLPMCRYLYHVRGAVTTTAANERTMEPNKPIEWFPIFAAVYQASGVITSPWLLERHHRAIETFKWLYQNGAKNEILKVAARYSPVSMLTMPEADDLAMWLVLEGALEDGTGKTSRYRLLRFLYELAHFSHKRTIGNIRDIFLAWLDEVLSPTNAFDTFLLGTVRNPEYSIDTMKRILAKRLGSLGAASMLVDGAIENCTCRDIWNKLMADAGRTSSANACLASLNGVLEKIGDYVGIIKSETGLRRIRDAQNIARTVTKEQLQSIMDDRPDFWD